MFAFGKRLLNLGRKIMRYLRLVMVKFANVYRSRRSKLGVIRPSRHEPAKMLNAIMVFHDEQYCTIFPCYFLRAISEQADQVSFHSTVCIVCVL
jgi:hypothetical protein